MLVRRGRLQVGGFLFFYFYFFFFSCNPACSCSPWQGGRMCAERRCVWRRWGREGGRGHAEAVGGALGDKRVGGMILIGGAWGMFAVGNGRAKPREMSQEKAMGRTVGNAWRRLFLSPLGTVAPHLRAQHSLIIQYVQFPRRCLNTIVLSSCWT
ncbi:hypothetical protein BDZ91DRAFT_456060 [Kalaharituber pfeilii]|nr:hypothetical protein BDZ91DRAFT_456060 [Kalaharituber pfeilii]